MHNQVMRSAMAGALLALGLLAPGIVAAVGGPIDLLLETRKVDTAGGALNRYALTDRDGDGYGVYLSYPSGRLVLERRDVWGATQLAASANTLIGGMALGQWYTLRLRLDNGQLIADAYPGEVDPATATPEVTVTANDPNHAEFTQLNVAGGRTYDTDDISVVADGQLVLAEDFDDGTIFAWGTFLSGQIALASDPAGGFVLRKSGFDDPNGGSVGLSAPALDLRFATRRVDLSGGGLNRYSVTDADGNGYGLYLNATNGRLALERRDGWVATALALSAGALPGNAMAPGDWYTLTLELRDGDLSAFAYLGRGVDPITATPEIGLTVQIPDDTNLTQFNVNGGFLYDTDDISVRIEGDLTLDEDFDDGDISDWRQFRANRGRVDPEPDPAAGGFVLRKSGFNDPNGGSVDLIPGLTLLSFDPATDGVADIGGYEIAHGLRLTGWALASAPAFSRDGKGISNTASVALAEFDPPVGRVEVYWARLADVDVAITAFDAAGNVVGYFFDEACPLRDCSLHAPAGVQTIIAAGITTLEVSGVAPNGSGLGPQEILGLDDLRFAP